MGSIKDMVPSWPYMRLCPPTPPRTMYTSTIFNVNHMIHPYMYIKFKKHCSYERGPKGLLFSRNRIIFLTRNLNTLSSYVELMVLDDITHYANLATLHKPFFFLGDNLRTRQQEHMRETFIHLCFMGIFSPYHPVVCPRRWRGRSYIFTRCGSVEVEACFCMKPAGA